MEVILVALSLLLGYVLGSIPAAYLAGRLLRGIDIRTVGSRNAGALNVFRFVHPVAGLGVLAFDAGKGALAVLIPGWMGAPEGAMYGAAVAAVAGHNWPMFAGFRGGKGAASILGISLALLPWITLIAVPPTVLVILVFRNVVFGIVVALLIIDALTIATAQPLGLIALCLGLSFFVAGTHFYANRHLVALALRSRRWKDLFGID